MSFLTCHEGSYLFSLHMVIQRPGSISLSPNTDLTPPNQIHGLCHQAAAHQRSQGRVAKQSRAGREEARLWGWSAVPVTLR